MSSTDHDTRLAEFQTKFGSALAKINDALQSSAYREAFNRPYIQLVESYEERPAPEEPTMPKEAYSGFGGGYDYNPDTAATHQQDLDRYQQDLDFYRRSHGHYKVMHDVPATLNMLNAMQFMLERLTPGIRKEITEGAFLGRDRLNFRTDPMFEGKASGQLMRSILRTGETLVDEIVHEYGGVDKLLKSTVSPDHQAVLEAVAELQALVPQLAEKNYLPALLEEHNKTCRLYALQLQSDLRRQEQQAGYDQQAAERRAAEEKQAQTAAQRNDLLAKFRKGGPGQSPSL